MTQQQLADKVGIKFQQIQKYETGMNRVSASRLWDVADALGVSISFFFEGLADDFSNAASALQPPPVEPPMIEPATPSSPPSAATMEPIPN